MKTIQIKDWQGKDKRNSWEKKKRKKENEEREKVKRRDESRHTEQGKNDSFQTRVKVNLKVSNALGETE